MQNLALPQPALVLTKVDELVDAFGAGAPVLPNISVARAAARGALVFDGSKNSAERVTLQPV